MPSIIANSHRQAAEHFDQAAHHSREAARHSEAGAPEQAGYHAHLSHGHATQAQGLLTLAAQQHAILYAQGRSAPPLPVHPAGPPSGPIDDPLM